MNPFALAYRGLAAKFGIVHQYVQHALEVSRVATPESETGAVDDLSVLGDIAGQNANSGSHRVQQSQRQALKFGRQDKHSGVRKQFFEI